jgi:hypothetical protein
MDRERHPPQRPTGRAAMIRHRRPGRATTASRPGRATAAPGHATTAPHLAIGVTA